MAAKNANQLSIGTCDVYLASNFIGYTQDEVRFRVEREKAVFESGLPLVPVASAVIRERASATFSFMQLSAQNLAYAAGADDSLNPDEVTVPGSTLVQGGGDSTLMSPILLELTHEFPDGRSLLITLWKARPDPTFEMVFSTGGFIPIASTWLAEEDTTRTAGKRLWRIDIEDETKS